MGTVLVLEAPGVMVICSYADALRTHRLCWDIVAAAERTDADPARP